MLLPEKYLRAAAEAGLGNGNGIYSHLTAVRREVEHERFERDRAAVHSGNRGEPTPAMARPSRSSKENKPRGMAVKQVSRWWWLWSGLVVPYIRTHATSCAAEFAHSIFLSLFSPFSPSDDMLGKTHWSGGFFVHPLFEILGFNALAADDACGWHGGARLRGRRRRRRRAVQAVGAAQAAEWGR